MATNDRCRSETHGTALSISDIQYPTSDLNELLKKLTQGKHDISEDGKEVVQAVSYIQRQGTPNTDNLEQLATVAANGIHSDEPWLEIIEQPKSKGIRFRYKCEGRSAGSIPGESSTNEHKTFPSVKINNFKDQAAIVVVSCVTKDEPHRPHPHTLVGKECRKGVCTIKLKRSNVATFPNLGIQCVTKKEIKDSLREREQIRVDPFGTGYQTDTSKLQLNIVRLCFQAFLPDDEGKYTRIVPPIVSNPIYDKKAVNDLVICRLSKQSGVAKGGDEVFLLCEKVNKDDIQVRFYEELHNEVVWEAFGDFQSVDVHRQFAIVFRTPQYKDQLITSPVEVYMHLLRPSDEGISEPKKFLYTPNDSDPENIQKKRKRKFVANSNTNTATVTTPAFNLLTDHIKDEHEQPQNVIIRERLKAKAARSHNKPTSEKRLGVSYGYTDVRSATAAPATAEEVIITPSDVEQIDGAQFLQQITVQSSGPVSDQPQNIYIMTSTGEQNSSDKEDVMLSDLPIGKALVDRMSQQEGESDQMESLPLPSLSQFPSMEIDSDFIKNVAVNIKTDGETSLETKPSTRMVTRGKKPKK